MKNKQKYMEIFESLFGVGKDAMDSLEYQGIPEWDSVGHMGLISAIEEAFDIMMDTEDIIDFSSYKKGMEILAKKYDVEF